MRLGRAFVAMAILLGGVCSSLLAVPDFSFVHLSDVHVPYALDTSRQTIAALPIGPIPLEPYGITAAAPAFAFVTGDLTEFGGGDGNWEKYLSLWTGLPYRVHHLAGNHDNTWDAIRPRLERLEGGDCYAFEQFGCKFIGWDTASPQDPRPSIATEGLSWLETEFARTPPGQPVFLFCHHPLDGSEFASDYDRARLLDILRTRNVVLLLVGHGHGVRAWQIEGLDTVMGGSTYGPNARGYGIVSVQGDVLRVAHQFEGPERKLQPLLEKPLAPRSPFLDLQVAPADGAVFRSGQRLVWTVGVSGPGTATGGRWVVDGESEGQLVRVAGGWQAVVPHDKLQPGAHAIRLELTAPDRPPTSRTLAFWLDEGPVRILWKRQLGGSCQATPAVSGPRVYAAANDGGLYAFMAASGRQLWRFQAGSMVRGGPVVGAGTLYFAAADGHVYALDGDGRLRWRADAGAPVFGSPALAGERLLVATNAGDIMALDTATGRPLWRTQAAAYSIETGPVVTADMVCAGAWDKYVHALDLANGSVRWRALSKGSDRTGAAQYYSPADAPPVVVQGKVWVCDRGYWLTGLDAASGERFAAEEKAAAVYASADGAHFYVRQSDGRVTRRTATGEVVWTTEVPTGHVPTPPVEAGGFVWMISGLGTLSKLEARSGRLVAQYKAFSDLYAFAAPAYDGVRVYLADMAGNLLALTMP